VHPPAGQPLDGCAERRLEAGLERGAHVADDLCATDVDQRALGDRQHVAQHGHDEVLPDVRLGLRRALAVVLGVDADDRLRDGGSHGPVDSGGRHRTQRRPRLLPVTAAR